MIGQGNLGSTVKVGEKLGNFKMNGCGTFQKTHLLYSAQGEML